MRIFYNPRSRKGLEANEQKVYEASVKQTENERMESESAGSADAKAEQKEETEEADKPATKKTGKKKADPIL